MNLGFVITTLGRVELLRTLLDSLQGQLDDGDTIIIVAQRNQDHVRELVLRYPSMPVSVTTSALGASRGRNAGVAELPPGDRVLLFPNDSTWFPEGVVGRIRADVGGEGFRVGAMSVVDDLGPKMKIAAPGAPFAPVDAWRVIEMGLLVTKTVFEDLGGFDASMGTGADTPWQAGESTDFVLRALERWPDLGSTFVWLPLETWVGGVPDTFGLDSSARRQKLRAYGRGAGKVGRDHRFPLRWKIRLLVGGVTIGLRHRQYSPTDGLWAFTGRLEGFLGRTLGGRNHIAVKR